MHYVRIYTGAAWYFVNNSTENTKSFKIILQPKRYVMTNQIQYTGEATIAEGKTEEFKKIIPLLIEAVQKNEPGVNAFQVYLNADETKAYLIGWFKNSEAVLAHFATGGSLLPGSGFQAIITFTRLEVFGNLTKEAADAVLAIGATIFKYQDGFIRGEIITPRTEVPADIVGAWENGSIDFELWENYQQGYYGGPNAVNSREAMVFSKKGDAEYYRYKLAHGVSEELIDCTGTVTFNQDATFTFYPGQGRKRFYDTKDTNNNTDTALTTTELADPGLALTRGYAYNGASNPPALQITVAGSEPYNWYKKPSPRTEVPDELVGGWEHGVINFEVWENYPEGRWAGRDAIPSREVMVFHKNGDAKFYRYEFAFNLYEELIDCTGTVTFNDNGTFTFYPGQGRMRHYDTRHSENNKDRPLTSTELAQPKLAGTRGYAYDGSSDPPLIRITVPSSAPYNWYKKS
jgi:quinol monooxygenase YgiN